MLSNQSQRRLGGDFGQMDPEPGFLTIEATRKMLSKLEFEILRTQHRLDLIESQLRTANNLNDAPGTGCWSAF